MYFGFGSWQQMQNFSTISQKLHQLVIVINTRIFSCFLLTLHRTYINIFHQILSLILHCLFNTSHYLLITSCHLTYPCTCNMREINIKTIIYILDRLPLLSFPILEEEEALCLIQTGRYLVKL